MEDTLRESKEQEQKGPEAPISEELLDRRRVVAGAGGLAVLAALWAPSQAVARVAHRRRGDVVLDVACLGETLARDFGAALDAAAGDLRGAGFFVEGLIRRPRRQPCRGDAVGGRQ